jgi:hypothetical protein
MICKNHYLHSLWKSHYPDASQNEDKLGCSGEFQVEGLLSTVIANVNGLPTPAMS